MNVQHGIRGRESGSFLFKVLITFSLLGMGMTLATRVGPGLYSYFLLRDLADTVVHSYGKLPLEEVQRRVAYEMHRSELSDEDFRVTKITRGYRVEVDYRIPLVFKIGEKEISWKGHEEWVLTYKVES